jgi:hypothetical protein
MEDMVMDITNTAENTSNRQVVATYWNLGPSTTSVKPNDNKAYWVKIAEIWNIGETQARTQLCANCEYYDNTSGMMLQMNKIPLDKFDMDGGGRGYCHKFDFICHNLRTCQAWESKEFKLMDKENEVETSKGRMADKLKIPERK